MSSSKKRKREETDEEPVNAQELLSHTTEYRSHEMVDDGAASQYFFYRHLECLLTSL